VTSDPDPPNREGGRSGPHRHLLEELRLLRVEGLGKVRELALPHLEDAAAELGYLDGDQPLRDGIEALLNAAITRFGQGPDQTAALRTFGLVAGGRLRNATDRRRAAAAALSVGTDRFRKFYEPRLLSAVAEEIGSLLAVAGAQAPAEPEEPREPAGPRPGSGGSALPLEVPPVLALARGSADWDLVEGVYRQCVDVAEDPHGTSIPRAVAGFLAEAFGRISANYYGREDELIRHALAILGNIDRSETISAELFRRLYHDPRFDRFARYAGGSTPIRRPRPFEALVETTRRFRDLNHLERCLHGLPTSAVLGGSLNYGRFFTVRGATPHESASDVDLLLVLPGFDPLHSVASGLRSLPGASADDVRALSERAEVFVAEGLDDDRTVFSHSIRMWERQDDPLVEWASNSSEYRLDLSIVSLTVLDRLLVADTAKLNGTSAGHGRSVREYRPRNGVTSEDHLRSFSGRNLRLAQDLEPAPGGVLRTSQVYAIEAESGRYYPGVLQNLVLPRFSRRWQSRDAVSLHGRMEAFRWKLIERLRYERRLRPYEMLRMSLAHTRWEMFAPHVLSAVDSNDNTA
jgi:hypothetical protein